MRTRREKDGAAATETTLVYHGVRHRISYLAQQCTNDLLRTLFSSSSFGKSIVRG